MTAQSILVQAEAAGLTLRPNGDNIGIKPVARLTPELKAALVEHKAAVLAALRAQRQVEVSTAYSATFSRLSITYDGDLVGTLWARIVNQHPALAHVVDVAEQAADLAALAFQQGSAADSSQFLACLSTWERAWAETIEAVTGDRCSDCGKRATKFCRACLRPSPIGKGAPHA